MIVVINIRYLFMIETITAVYWNRFNNTTL